MICKKFLMIFGIICYIFLNENVLSQKLIETKVVLNCEEEADCAPSNQCTYNNIQGNRLTNWEYQHSSEKICTHFIRPPNVFNITIMNSSIESLPKGLFTVYTNATTLTVQNNGIQHIKFNDFYGGEKLQSINLAFNNITAVPNMVFAFNPNLISLNLSANNISRIEEKSFYGLRKLKSLDLSRNKIGNLEPSTFNELIDVEIILLDGNMLKLLSENIFVRNKLLKNINLSNNSVETMALPESDTSGAYKFIKRYIRSTSGNQQLFNDTELVRATKNEIQDILDLLQEGEANIKYPTNQDVILLLGSTGTGKSTFSLYITGNDDNLTSQETEEDLGEFIIVDNNNKVSDNSTITSHTIFPELVLDTGKNIAFYDCPGFSDTRSAAHDISATYFIKKLIDSANKIKLVFVTSYHSVRKGSDRLGFPQLLKHAVTMIKNIDKFKDSIALIVTKVDNVYGKKGLVPDENVIKGIAKFLKIVRNETDILKDPILNKNAIRFIDFLLEKDGEYYKKIGIFRRPDEPGVLSNISLLQDGKKTLETIFHENLQFSKHNAGDFGYTISAESLNYVTTLVEKINENIASNIVDLGQEIEKHYSTQEEQLNDIQELYNIFALGYDSLSATKIKTSEFVELQDFVRQITKNLNDLNISVSHKNLLNIENYSQYLKFIKDISGQDTVKPLAWAEGLTNIVQYLSDSQIWYGFLIRLYTTLSKYDIQRDINKYASMTNDLKYQIVDNDHQKLQITESFKIFLNAVIGQDSEKEYNNLKHIKLDKLKLKFLNKILDLTLKEDMSVSCENQKLVMKGQYIKLSDIEKVQCSQPKFIDIFALNTVFIDIDLNKTGEKVSLSIIAPTWDIIGSPQIILDGMPGMAHNPAKAQNGIGSGSNGEDGKPGLPGGNAGQFLGIGKNFYNDKSLSISANGGKGGPGQHGGDGIEGNDGETPTLPKGKEEEEESRRKFWYEPIGNDSVLQVYIVYNNHDTFSLFNIHGTLATKGGNGGDGGIGGKGGNPGYINIIGLDNNPQILDHTAKGADGEDGIGGKGGLGGKNGDILSAKFTTSFETYSLMAFFKEYWTKLSCSEGETALSGQSGINGHNYKGIQQPEKVVQNIYTSHTINNYKNNLRENLIGVRKSFSRKFINQLGNDNNITDLYDTLGLVNEFQGLEDQFYKLRTKISFVPFYKSLLQRISQYAKNPANNEKSIEYKKVLSYLYTATLSKIYSINNNVANNLVIDFQEYLKLVVGDINKLKELSNTVTINEYKNKFQQAIKKKTNEAESFIDNEITPEINNIFNQINHEIELLIGETITLKNKTIEEKSKLKKQKQKLEDQLVIRKILGIVTFANQFLGLLGPEGATASKAVGGGITIIESLVLDNSGTQDISKIDTLPFGVESTLTRITDQLTNKQKLFTEQLHDVEQKLDTFLKPSNDIAEIKKKISVTKLNLNQDIAKGLDVEYVDKIDIVQKEVVKFVDNLKTTLEGQKTDMDINIEDELNIVNDVQNILSITGISIDSYNKIRKHQDQIDKLSYVIRQAGAKLSKLEQYENAIYKIIIPKYRDLKNHLAMTQENLKDQSHVGLDISKWQIQSTIKDVKFQMQKMTEGFKVQEDLQRCIDKLLEGMTIMVNIYDRIDDYRDKAELAAYIADINSKKSLEIIINNTELNNAIDDLKLNIQSNLVLEKYEIAMKAFRQHFFPTADFYLAEFNLPTSLKSNDPNNVTSLVVSKIETLQFKVSESITTINKYDKHIYNDVMFNSSSHIAPFLVWQHNKNKNAISKLLEGEEITIKADITQGLEYYAIKFNEIGIHFKLANETIQHEFDKQLHGFEVTMTHLGNSYYRCDNKFYIITSDKQVINYSFRKTNNGEPSIKNDVYNKIKKNHPVLSPYTMWKIKLKNKKNNVSKLAKYKNHVIDLELEGRGQYVDQEINVCNDNLNKYYTLDDTLS